MSNQTIWPDRLWLRDTHLHDDMGGAGQRIYTTAGQGYEKCEYVRVDLVATPGATLTGEDSVRQSAESSRPRELLYRGTVSAPGMQASVARGRLSSERCCRSVDELLEDPHATFAELEQLRAAPWKYGKHLTSCRLQDTPDTGCTCGWAPIRETLSGEPPSPVETSDWRPIETAPKDRLIDLWTGNRRLTGCWWDSICSEWRTLGNSNKLIWFKTATHWREIPKAPGDNG